MKRRTLLRSVGAGALGCAGCMSGESRTDATPTGTEMDTQTATQTATATQTPTRTSTATTSALDTCAVTGVNTAPEPGEGWPRISVAADESPRADLTMNVSVLGQFTDACPAAIRIAFTYTGDTPDPRIEFGRSPPFSDYLPENSCPACVSILPIHKNGHLGGPEEIPTAKRDGCWSIESYTAYPTGITLGLEPGETVSEDFKVYTYPSAETCLPAGEHRFEKSYFTHDTEWRWGFDLSLDY